MDAEQPIPAAPVTDLGAPIPASPEGGADGVPIVPAGQDTQIQPIPVTQTQAVTQAPPAVESGTLPLIAGYLNIGVGLVVLAMFGMYFAGFGIWITHLKVTGRDEGIAWMERAVQTAFWLVVLLGIVRFVQYNTQAALAILSIIVLLVIAWLAFKVIQASGAEDDEH